MKKPPIQPKYSKGELQERYSRLVDGKLRKLEKIFEKRFRSKETLDDQQIAKCIFGEGKNKERKIKRSTSLFDITSFVDFNGGETLNNNSDTKNSEDDIGKLSKLSVMNMGARYELLNANQMMLNLDLELVRI